MKQFKPIIQDHEILNNFLCSQNAGSTNSLDSSFSSLAKEFSLNNDGLVGKSSFSQNFIVSSLGNINNWGLVSDVLVFGSSFFRDQAPQFVEVDDGSVLLVLLQVEVSLSLLTESTRVAMKLDLSSWILLSIDVSSVVSETTSLTTTTGVLSMLADSTTTELGVTSQLSCLSESCSLKKVSNESQ